MIHPGGARGAVLDASALLAYLGDEPGADVVADAVAGGAAMGTANVAEALSVLAGRGQEPAQVMAQLSQQGLLGGAVSLEPLSSEDAVEVARLRPATKAAGLSLADRACLALAARLGAPALTADRAWAQLELEVQVLVIRDRG